MEAYPPAVREEVSRLYERYADDVYRYARFALGGEDDAYDVVQEVFLRALRGWSRFRGEASERTWLLQIARNVMCDKFRRRRSEQAALRCAPVPDSKWQHTVEASVVIESAIRRLRDSYQQVVILRHIEGLTVEETAQVLGWNENKVRSTTHRALVKLRDMLSDDDETEVGGH
ncbi:RNA polymerase sigma (SigX) subunit [Alicyclobacillus sacchari]|uniref:RNA polymerase sigma (SigX) subunit n=1 Tax=Alicyclobacillus sacchari TaxID=392010 RepID=A0A4R8LWW9_9BACL|nr:sigma-70 family RNA polymerase sigma factor [Alicyclobacillus sacchari]TDY51196.1 RNA polymerase sigma (SigX) subunit [Alicyclobacillus sacchari]GMA56461.1 ECF RNA polymerase sigma factor SigX [Alicyclobacillus sacchari]